MRSGWSRLYKIRGLTLDKVTRAAAAATNYVRSGAEWVLFSRTAPCPWRTAGLTELLWGAALNNRVKVLRTERGWSQVELGEKIGISRQSVYAIESGKFDPSLPVAFRIADIFGMPIEEIFEKPTRS